MRILIFGKTIEKSYEKMQDILIEYDKKDIHTIYKQEHSYTVFFKNNNTIVATIPNSSVRSLRASKIYVDREINYKINANFIVKYLYSGIKEEEGIYLYE